MRRKRPSEANTALISSKARPLLTPHITQQPWMVSDGQNEINVPIIPISSGEEKSSSSYVYSVDSLEDESAEDSQDDDGKNLVCDDSATCHDFLSDIQPLLDQLPNEISMQLRSRVACLIEAWLSHKNLQRPVHPCENSQPSSSTTVASNLTTTAQTGTGRKRAPSDGDGSSPSGDRGDGNGKRPKARVALQPGSNNRRWACPYYQREPHRYCLGEWRLCAKSPGFSQVHRVK
jgi:hypothetical protein